MKARTPQLVVFLALLYTGISAEKTNNHRIPVVNGSSLESSISVLEDALVAMTNLTNEQKVLQEQQHLYEKEARERNAKDEERQSVLSRTLNKQQELFKGAWGSFKRSMKTLRKDKNTNTGNNCPDTDSSKVLPKDCADYYLQGDDVSGIYRIWPIWERDKTRYLVYCDMETDGGGWTVIHRWGNYNFPANYFRRSWNDYKRGFGDLNTAFWLGNDLIYFLTSQGPYKLRFDMDEYPGDEYVYDRFWIENESQSYKLHVEGFGDNSTHLKQSNIFGRHNGSTFSTFDRNNACTETRYGWWFERNQYCIFDNKLRLSFQPASKSETILKKEMKIRPVYFEKMKKNI